MATSTRPLPAHGSRLRREPSLIPNYVVLGALLIFALGPLVILTFNSLKDRAELGRNPLGPPQQFLIGNFAEAWQVGNFAVTTRNSGILVAGTVFGVLFLGGMAAYSLAKLNLPGAGLLTMYLLIGTSLPIQLYLVPLFFSWQRLSLVNTLHGLILIYIATNAPFAVFLLRAYMLQIPSDFEDAARVDGASEWRVFRSVVLPVIRPVLATLGIWTFLATWNDFMWPLIVLSDESRYTLPVALANLAGEHVQDTELMMAGSVLTVLPVLAVFLFLQRYYIQGIMAGSVKG